MSTADAIFQLDNPVYGTGDELTAAGQPRTAATPEHNLINPLYGPINVSGSHAQGQAEDLTVHEYAVLETLNGVTAPHY